MGFSEREKEAFPAEFAKLATNGYLAVVHADGNSVGMRLREYRRSSDTDDFLTQWWRRESFFHTLRSGMRIAVRGALPKVFADYHTKAGCAPLRLLMLGGDDLTLVCAAPLALPFVVALAEELLLSTANLPGGKDGTRAPLTFGAGVAIVQQNFPFYRAYELAEQLATHAKHLKSSLPAEEGNVVDWLLVSESWHGDVGGTRRQDCVVDGKLVLSAKPYRVLAAKKSGSEDAAGPADKSLAEMLADAKHLANGTRENRAARASCTP